MKRHYLALLLASSAFFSGCSYIPINEGVARRVSPDYTASGPVTDARAYVYGIHTVLEFDSAPSFLIVKDVSGTTVDYERVGRLYRLSRRLDNFTVWVNGRSATFSAVTTTRVFSGPIRPMPSSSQPVPAQLSSIAADTSKPGDIDVAALLKLSEKQLDEVRQAIESAGKNHKATGADLFNVNERLDEIEARLVTAAAAIVQVRFATNSTTFKPSDEVAKVLVNAAKAANSVSVRGHTDAKIAGPNDARIALGRALAARKFLLDNGIGSDKIRVFSQADGGFTVPNVSNEGRALNRRVEIEFVNARIAVLAGQAVKLAKK